MKYLRFFCFLVLFFLFYYSNAQHNNVIIEGKLQNVEDGIVIYLSKSDGKLILPIASDTVKNGSFKIVFADSVAEPKLLMLMSRGNGFPPGWLNLWITPRARIQINGKDKLLKTWDVKSNIKEQIVQNKYVIATKMQQIRTQELMRDAYALFDEMDKKPHNSKIYKLQIDSLYHIEDSITNLILLNELDLMNKSKSIELAWMNKLYEHSFQYRYSKSYPDKKMLFKLFDRLPASKRESNLGRLITINLKNITIVGEGDLMADSDLYDLENKVHHLSDYKGKYILIDFWSMGCKPCIDAMPEMKEIAEQYKDKLVIVGISLDGKNTWQKVSKKKDITWVNLNDYQGDNGISMRYGVKGIPHFVVISPDGIILSSWGGFGVGSLKDKISQLIK